MFTYFSLRCQYHNLHFYYNQKSIAAELTCRLHRCSTTLRRGLNSSKQKITKPNTSQNLVPWFHMDSASTTLLNEHSIKYVNMSHSLIKIVVGTRYRDSERVDENKI